ncbi:MAG TPA: methyltransferase domain-containing protein [Steroidobacteraceae bacterium]|jgi:2-polyprenyl-3-methyl-5-hydroxy-6-metoxy-1,4-benzoquinol methylase|nr:methyltransferase domain-containing protein [Steroidobacteraceae bacterium]
MPPEATNYDAFSQIYNRHWGAQYANFALETLAPLLEKIPAGGRILDLCCGSGQTSRRLADRGFSVVGIDNSPSLITLATRNAPNASFEIADAREFTLPGSFHAVISLNDSLNHLLTIEDLMSAFTSVARCLPSDGIFLFDLNLAHKYETSWGGSMSIVEDDAVCAIVVESNLQQKLATFDAATFIKIHGVWSREDAHLCQTWYEPEKIAAALQQTGFVNVQISDRKGTKLNNWAVDKAFFWCTRA